MSNNTNKSFQNESENTSIVFSCLSYKCECRLGNIGVEDYGIMPTLFLKNTSYGSGLFEYTFFPKRGLVQNDTGKDDIMESLVALDDDNIEQIRDFLNTYGFPILPFFLYSANGIAECSYYKANEILQCVKKQALLINEIKLKKQLTDKQDLKNNIDKIFDLTTFLIFHKPVKLEVAGEGDRYCSPVTDIYRSLYGYEDRDKGIEDDYYHSSANNEDYEDYEDYEDKEPLASFLLKQDDTLSFWGDDDYRITGFEFYKKMNQDLIITGMKENGTLVFKEKFSKLFSEDEEMISTLMYLAEMTIKSNFDYALKDIHPTYSCEKNILDWFVPDLMSGMYFALLGKPEEEVFKKCANPRCKGVGYFSDSINNNKRKYCCRECQNSMGQAMYRKRQLYKE